MDWLADEAVWPNQQYFSQFVLSKSVGLNCPKKQAMLLKPARRTDKEGIWW